MSFFPTWFDPRHPEVLCLSLVALDVPATDDWDAYTARFAVGVDEIFYDFDGNAWIGSALLQVSAMESAIGGTAPQGEYTLSYFQDPDGTDLASQIVAQGPNWLIGQPVREYIQVFASQAERSAPRVVPLIFQTRSVSAVRFDAEGVVNRSIRVSVESGSRDRGLSRRLAYNTAGHEVLIGAANPSLELMPTDDFEEQPIWG